MTGFVNKTRHFIKRVPVLGYLVWWVYMILKAPSKIHVLYAEIARLGDKIETLENRIETLENRIETLENRIETLERAGYRAKIKRKSEKTQISVEASKKIRLGWVSTWNTRCGIAMYSKYLTESLNKNDFELKIFASSLGERLQGDGPNIIRYCGNAAQGNLYDLIQNIFHEEIEALVIQFQVSFFEINSFGKMIDVLKEAGIKIFIIFHSTVDVTSLFWIKENLKKADALLVHSISDVNRLRSFSLIENVTLFPHGVLSRLHEDADKLKEKMGQSGKRIISSYGFLLPHKGIKELIQAFSMLATKKPMMHLLLVNSLYPVPSSDETKKECLKIINELNISNKVTMITDFLDDKKSLSLLGCSDLIVFPYLNTQESTSAAVRFGLATNRPVACTPLDIFDDVKETVHFLPGSKPEEIAEGIEHLLNNPDKLNEKREIQKRWLEDHSWDVVGKQLGSIIKTV